MATLKKRDHFNERSKIDVPNQELKVLSNKRETERGREREREPTLVA